MPFLVHQKAILVVQAKRVAARIQNDASADLPIRLARFADTLGRELKVTGESKLDNRTRSLTEIDHERSTFPSDLSICMSG